VSIRYSNAFIKSWRIDISAISMGATRRGVPLVGVESQESIDPVIVASHIGRRSCNFSRGMTFD
jgi:hypothetical protein